MKTVFKSRIVILMIVLSPIVVFSQDDIVTVNRSFDPSFFEAGGGTHTVILRVNNPAATAQTVDIEDFAPSEWTVSDADNNGTISGTTVQWSAYIASPGVSLLTYKVKTAANAAESGGFEGYIGADLITGSSSLLFLFPQLKSLKLNAPALSNAVTLDGIMSPGEWTGAVTFTFDMEDQEAPGVGISDQRPKEQQNGTGYVFHDSGNIYAALDIVDDFLDFATDGSTWQHDSTEIYFDGNLSRLVSMEQNPQGFQGTVMGDGSRVGGDGAPTVTPIAGGGGMSADGAWWNFGANAKADGSGYIVEYMVSKSILDPPDRTLIGFDVLINGSDNEGDSNREAKWGWFQTLEDGTTGEYWNNELGWGIVELSGQISGMDDWSSY